MRIKLFSPPAPSDIKLFDTNRQQIRSVFYPSRSKRSINITPRATVIAKTKWAARMSGKKHISPRLLSKCRTTRPRFDIFSNTNGLLSFLEENLLQESGEIKLFRGTVGQPGWANLLPYETFAEAIGKHDLWSRFGEIKSAIKDDKTPVATLFRDLEKAFDDVDDYPDFEWRCGSRRLYGCAGCQIIIDRKPESTSADTCPDGDECLCPHPCCCDDLVEVP